MDINIYNFDDYREFIKAKVGVQKNRWGLWTKLAEAAACQLAYLSQSIKGRSNLTADHIFGIAEYWNMTDAEKEYFLLLLEYSRCGNKGLRDFILRKIKQKQKEHKDLANRIKKPQIATGIMDQIYYSSWYWSAIHVIVSISDYETANSISQRLSIPVSLVESILKQLEQMQLVVRAGKKWKMGVGHIHLPSDSPLIGMHHNNWRQRAVLDATTPDGQGVHFSSVYSVSRRDYEVLKDKVIDFVQKSQKVMELSPAEELVCLNADIFIV